MKAVYKSDVGQKRTNNEDSVIVDCEKNIFLLADGMGGHQAGEVASNLAVSEVYDYLSNKVTNFGEGAIPFDFLTDALLKAHDTIKEKARTNLSLRGMGTTLVEMITKDRKAYICHVGDSRAYLIREDIKQITRDHTLGNYLVENKIMKKEEVPAKKWHTLTQALGATEHISPETNELYLLPDDIILLCSDGLTDMLNDREIGQIIKSYRNDLDKALGILIEEANNRGGNDNISVILVGIE